MLNKLALKVMTLSMLTMLALTASADNFYIGASAGQSDVDDLCDGLVVTSCDETDSAYKLFAGYKFNKNFAIEGSYVDFGEFTAKDAVSGVKARAEVDSFGIAVMGILPVAKHFDLFAKLGFHSWDTKAVATGNNVRATEDDSGTDVVYGLGASYSFTDSVAIRAEWENYDSEDDVNVISAGLTYSF